jgi:drug/metabolite transporter (DMT)-like permease
MDWRITRSRLLSFVVTTADNVIADRRAASSAPVPHRNAGLLLACLGVLTFSFSMPMTKIAVRGLDPVVAAIGRAAVAGLLSVAIIALVRPSRPTARQVRRLLRVMGGVVVGFPLLTAYALQSTDSMHGSVVNGLLPLATAGLAVIRAGERPSARYWMCSAVGFGAVLTFVVIEGGGRLHRADALLVLAVLAAAVGYTEGALLAREMGGWQVITWALALASPATIAITIVGIDRTGIDASPGQWAAFAYTAVFSMLLGFFAWYAGMARAGIARAGQLQLAQPALSLLWGWPLLGERLTMLAVATVVVVLASVAAGRRAPIRVSPERVMTAQSALAVRPIATSME